MQLNQLNKAEAGLVQLQKENKPDTKVSYIVMAVIGFMQRAKDILFQNGQYKGVKWYQIGRVVKLVKLTVDFVKLIIRIF
jgi:hypothetical protein